MIYHEDEPGRRIWFIKRGTVVLVRDLDGESEGHVRAVRFPGTFIGIEALISDQYTDAARAASNVTLCSIAREAIDTWLGPPEMPARVALELTLRAACTDRMRSAAPDGTAVQRLAAWLCDEGPRHVMAVIPRKSVADLLGMRPETLSRALAELVKRGAIESGRNRLSIVSVDRLREAAGRN
jgi:CRP/FNR family transcriptional activator FtrB